MHQLKQVAVRALIVDDEEPARTNVRLSLARHPNWEIVGEHSSAASLRSALPGIAADVVFLDIQMPGESGLSLAASLAGLETPPMIIFVTAYSDYAVNAFDLHALDYLTKPWHSKRFSQAVERAESLLALRQRDPYRLAVLNCVNDSGVGYLDALTIRSVGLIERVQLAQVQWIGAAGNYVELHVHARTLLHRVTISHLEARLNPRDFLRVHRTAIVRRPECVALSTIGDGRYEVRLRCGAQIPVSERYVDAVRRCIEAVS
ncbi:LytTR family DNA-binding domain-containing protein [Pseudoduganella ginsengisoli]